MRMSCNGCRILRKGCSENCSIRPCLQWIKNPESQANATVFLAKFYGRAGLLNLINAGPEHLRPAIFRSLLYEACGRIVNPIYGSAGLLCSGNWHLCNSAVESILNGLPISQVSSDSAAGSTSPPLKACDIRHVSKHADASSGVLHKVKGGGRFKRSGGKTKPRSGSDVDDAAHVIWSWSHKDRLEGSPSDDDDKAAASRRGERRSRETHTPEADTVSVETVEASLAKLDDRAADLSDVGLELTLGFQPVARAKKVVPSDGTDSSNRSDSATSVELGLQYNAP